MAVITTSDNSKNGMSLFWFVLIGLILLGLLLGGVWWAKQRSIAANKPQTITAQSEQKKNDKPAATPKPKTQDKAATSIASSNSSATSTGNKPSQNSNSAVAAATTGPKSIASTGPSIKEMVMLGSLIAISGYFAIRLIQIHTSTRAWLQQR